MNTLAIVAIACGLSVALGQGMMGGYKDQNPSDERWTTLLRSLVQAGSIGDISNHVNILDVKTQVVAGMNTMFVLDVDGKNCNLVVYTNLQSINRVTSDSCQLSSYKSVGGYTKITDTSDSNFQHAVGMVLDTASNQVNSMYRLTESNILTAESQVVAGMNYHIKLEVGMSSCLKSDDNVGMSSTMCALSSTSSQRYIVDAIVFWQSWMTPAYKVTSIQITLP